MARLVARDTTGPVAYAALNTDPRSSWRRVAAAALLTAATAATVMACWPARWGSSTAPAERVSEPRPAPAPPSPVPVAPPPAAPGAAAPPGGPLVSGVPAAPVRAPRWKVRSILVSADRRLALVDGRIVGPGDRVGRETVVEIGERDLVMADAAGRPRRVQLWERRPGVVVR